MSDETGHSDLVQACRRWQSGRDGGSSLLRGAARVLTEIPHYFDSPYIRKYEKQARADESSQCHAAALMRAISSSSPKTGSEWAGPGATPAPAFAGRGLRCKPEEDPQIIASLQAGALAMPLWGVSLDRGVAEGFGTRFLLCIEGPFHGVAAWRESGEQEDQQEIITGGRYEVLDRVSVDRLDKDETIVVRLREVGTIEPPSAS